MGADCGKNKEREEGALLMWLVCKGKKELVMEE